MFTKLDLSASALLESVSNRNGPLARRLPSSWPIFLIDELRLGRCPIAFPGEIRIQDQCRRRDVDAADHQILRAVRPRGLRRPGSTLCASPGSRAGKSE